MQIEYEATFTGINKDGFRKKLINTGAKLIRPEFLQKRYVYHLPQGHQIPGGWVRVRDERGQITMSLKVVDGDKIADQKEINLKVDDMTNAREFLTALGCVKKSYQETKREIWNKSGVAVTIDEWPFLEPFVEIEGNSEKNVKQVSAQLGFDYQQAKFCAIGQLYLEKYNISLDIINNKTPKLTFNMDNPFAVKKKP